MVYKKYLKKRGKTFGPYYYESYRDNGKVKKRYLGGERKYRRLKQREERKSFGRILFIFSLFFLVFFIIGEINTNVKAVMSFSSEFANPNLLKFSGFSISENSSGISLKNLSYQNYEEEIIEKQIVNEMGTVKIKSPPKIDGAAITKNKNKRIEFELANAKIKLYFDLLNYKQFSESLEQEAINMENIENIGDIEKPSPEETEENIKIKLKEEEKEKKQETENTTQEPEGIIKETENTTQEPEGIIKETENTTQEQEEIIEVNTSSSIDNITGSGADNEISNEINNTEALEAKKTFENTNNSENGDISQGGIEETQEEKSELESEPEPEPEPEPKQEVIESIGESLVTGNIINSFLTITGFVVSNTLNLKSEELGGEVDKSKNSNELIKTEIQKIAEKSIISAEEFDIDFNESEEEQYKWGYKFQLNDLDFMAKIHISSDKSISKWDKTTVRVGNNLLSFEDLIKQGYTIHIGELDLKSRYFSKEIFPEKQEIEEPEVKSVVEPEAEPESEPETKVEPGEEEIEEGTETNETQEEENITQEQENITLEEGGDEIIIEINKSISVDNETDSGVDSEINDTEGLEVLQEEPEVELKIEPETVSESEAEVESEPETEAEPEPEAELEPEEPTVVESISDSLITGNVINDFLTITGFVANDLLGSESEIIDEGDNILDVEDNNYENEIIIYIERDFRNTSYQLGDIINLDPTLIKLEILNPYTYLKDGDDWYVRFDTIGEGNLSIWSNNSYWREIQEDNGSTIDEMKFLNISCGGNLLFNSLKIIDSENNTYNYLDINENDSIRPFKFFIQDYSCEGSTGEFVNNMNIAGYATLIFKFENQDGWVIDYAFDPAKASSCPGYDDGTYCWILGSDEQSCDTVCSGEASSCVNSPWNDDDRCTILNVLTGDSCEGGGCEVGAEFYFPAFVEETICIYREPKLLQYCSDGDFGVERACACDLSDFTTSVEGNRFEIKDSSGNVIAVIDESGDMFLKGILTESPFGVSPPGNSFILKDKAGTNIAYINNSGYLFITGTLTESASMTVSGSNLEIRNNANSLVAFFDDEGNVKLNGSLTESYSF